MKVKWLIFPFLFVSILFSCAFQPNNSEGIILQRKSNDTLIVSIIDSYNIIDKYKIQEKGDTLFIEVLSLSSPNSKDMVQPTLVPIKTGINYIKLQNDKTYDIDSIPFSSYDIGF